MSQCTTTHHRLPPTNNYDSHNFLLSHKKVHNFFLMNAIKTNQTKKKTDAVLIIFRKNSKNRNYYKHFKLRHYSCIFPSAKLK